VEMVRLVWKVVVVHVQRCMLVSTSACDVFLYFLSFVASWFQQVYTKGKEGFNCINVKLEGKHKTQEIVKKIKSKKNSREITS